MDLVQFKKDIDIIKKELNDMGKLTQEITGLLDNQKTGVLKLKDRVGKLQKLLSYYPQSQLNIKEIENHLEELTKQIERDLTQRKITFTNLLAKELQNVGYCLVGQFPNLSIGLFSILPDFESNKVKIWYGNKQEVLEPCNLDVDKIVNAIGKYELELGSGLNGEEFLVKLEQAYKRVQDARSIAQVPIIEVLYELAHLIQNHQFQIDPQKDNYRSYSRADFSYDLYRLARHEKNVLRSRVRLVVATKANTIKREQFLWIPNDNQGNGTVYSHIQISEVNA